MIAVRKILLLIINSCRALAEIVQILNEFSGSQSYGGYSYLLCAVYVLIIPVSTPVTFQAGTF